MHDTPLTETGKKRGKQIGQYLLGKSINVTHVYSSANLRGKQTAEFIADAYHLPVIVKPELNERNWGELKNKPWEEVSKELSGLSIDERFSFIPKNGESWKQMEERLLGILEEIAEEAKDGEDIVIVTHRGDLRAILPLLAKAAREKHEDFSVQLGSLNRFSFDTKEFDFLKLLPDED